MKKIILIVLYSLVLHSCQDFKSNANTEVKLSDETDLNIIYDTVFTSFYQPTYISFNKKIDSIHVELTEEIRDSLGLPTPLFISSFKDSLLVLNPRIDHFDTTVVIVYIGGDNLTFTVVEEITDGYNFYDLSGNNTYTGVDTCFVGVNDMVKLPADSSFKYNYFGEEPMLFNLYEDTTFWIQSKNEIFTEATILVKQQYKYGFVKIISK